MRPRVAYRMAAKSPRKEFEPPKRAKHHIVKRTASWAKGKPSAEKSTKRLSRTAFKKVRAAILLKNKETGVANAEIRKRDSQATAQQLAREQENLAVRRSSLAIGGKNQQLTVADMNQAYMIAASMRSLNRALQGKQPPISRKRIIEACAKAIDRNVETIRAYINNFLDTDGSMAYPVHQQRGPPPSRQVPA